ncbi:MAG: hypothetical protein JRI25_27710 [Deltaproteobacteria bacterium]|nr:hypothetical protein [Deltaproteobacteria bacterium]
MGVYESGYDGHPGRVNANGARSTQSTPERDNAVVLNEDGDTLGRIATRPVDDPGVLDEEAILRWRRSVTTSTGDEPADNQEQGPAIHR